MGLRLWLPLNGNLNNYGASNVTVTNSNATVDASGKIGQCYYFNGSNSWIKVSMPSGITSIKNTSICAWIKSTGSVVALGGISNNTNYADAMVTLYTSGWQLSGESGYKYINGGSIANTSVWHHVCCTIDDTTITTYLDGTKVTSNTLSGLGIGVTAINSNNFIEIGCDHPGGDEFLTGYVNDFRVYDHALSPKEVKEISKGLICHYPLDGNGKGNDNLLKTTPRSANTTAYNAYAINLAENLTIGKKYTIQFWDVNISHSGKTASQLKVDVYWGGGMNSECQIYVPTGHADYLETTFTATANGKPSEAENAWLNIYNSVPNVSGTMSLTIGHWKIEEGEKATPWCPASTDTEYTTLGYNNTIEYDISGYKYNGTRSGTLTSDNDTAKYNAATTFSSNSHISTTLNATGYANTYTFAWWGKFTNYSNTMMWGFANGNRLNLFMSGGNFYWNTGDSANNPFSGVSSTTYGDRNWHHFAVSGDGTTSKLYIDGVFKANSKTYKGITGTTLIFNGWDTSTSYNFNGSLSDFRLYATALSADDVKELYQSSAFVTNNGSVMCYDFVEQ